MGLVIMGGRNKGRVFVSSMWGVNGIYLGV